MIRLSVVAAMVALSFSAIALADPSDTVPKLLTVTKESTVKGKKTSKEIVVGLVAMNSALTANGSGCEQRAGVVKVEGVQFSRSGVTLESFRFTSKSGDQWSMPTGIDGLSNTDRSQANNFIRVGKSYFMRFQVCGSGGFPDLLDLYDLAFVNSRV